VATDELLDHLDGVDALLCLLNDTIDERVLATPTLTVVATVAVGVDNIDLDAARRHDVAVVNTPGVLDASTADLAVLLMLAARRRASEAEADLRAGRWTGWSLDDHLGDDLTGSTVGLVGLGRIGSTVARRLLGFDVTVLHHTRRDTGLPGWCPSMLDLAAHVDVLSLHVPLTDATKGLVDDAVFEAMHPRSVLVNTARGAVVDEAALVRALSSGTIAAAGLDVFEGEPTVSTALLACEGTVLLPHIGSATRATRLAMCDLAAAGLLEVLAGRRPDNVVE
jgi:glyoxylate reductase